MDLLRSTFEIYDGKQPGYSVKGGAKLIIETLTEREDVRIGPYRLDWQLEVMLWV
jgi:hypothetical protein